MQIVELADPGEAGLQHLHIGLGGDGLDIVGVQPVEKPVHQLAPAPEVVLTGAAVFREPRHAALEGVAVDVAEPREADGVALDARGRRDAGGDVDDQAGIHHELDLLGPGLANQGALEPQLLHRRLSSMLRFNV